VKRIIDKWLEHFLVSEKKVPGYLGTTAIMETGIDSGARHMIHRFRDEASLDAWEN
jgi:antibiotic biosynthesis monooxygenase (ABM) superfamily enzyme